MDKHDFGLAPFLPPGYIQQPLELGAPAGYGADGRPPGTPASSGTIGGTSSGDSGNISALAERAVAPGQEWTDGNLLRGDLHSNEPEITRFTLSACSGARGAATGSPRHYTRVVVQPLGINVEHWSGLSRTPAAVDLPGLGPGRMILSVDRVDYTKSVLERLRIVDRFFEVNSHLRGEVTFVQVCGRTRPGVEAFDRYWVQCRELFQQVSSRWKTDNWAPVYWIEQSLSPAQLALLYQRADVMLVNAVRDGLNLTAKEYVACQSSTPGVLLLSPGTGAWHELGRYALNANPLQPDAVVQNLTRALAMGAPERKLRMDLLSEEVGRNPLSQWWTLFCSLARDHRETRPPLFFSKTSKIVH